MKRSDSALWLTVLVLLGYPSFAGAQQAFVQISGAPCVTPPALHCPDADCPFSC